jgi:Zn-dependent alcohol dehydrogenase
VCELPVEPLYERPCGRCVECAGESCTCDRFQQAGVDVISASRVRVEVWPVEQVRRHFGCADVEKVAEIDQRQAAVISETIKIEWTAGIGVFLRRMTWGAAS